MIPHVFTDFKFLPNQVDLTSFISLAGCSCLNESDGNTFQNILKKGPAFLESDCDEQVRCLNLYHHFHPLCQYSYKVASKALFRLLGGSVLDDVEAK